MSLSEIAEAQSEELATDDDVESQALWRGARARIALGWLWMLAAVLIAFTRSATGAILLVARLFRLGFVANFISDPVLTGFKAGIGLVIVVDQLPKVLGVHIDKTGFFRDVLQIIHHVPEASLATLLAVIFGVPLAWWLARARYAVGQGAQQDVLRAQVEITRFEQLRAEYAAYYAACSVRPEHAGNVAYYKGAPDTTRISSIVASVIGTTKDWNMGVATFNPSTALKIDTAGVRIPSPYSSAAPKIPRASRQAQTAKQRRRSRRSSAPTPRSMTPSRRWLARTCPGSAPTTCSRRRRSRT